MGSADERPHEAGLVHFHEHLLFKGTKRLGVSERINACTSFDVAAYHATLPSDAPQKSARSYLASESGRLRTSRARTVKRAAGVIAPLGDPPQSDPIRKRPVVEHPWRGSGEALRARRRRA